MAQETASTSFIPPESGCDDQAFPPSVVDRSSGSSPEAVLFPDTMQWVSEGQSISVPVTPGMVCCTDQMAPPSVDARMALSSPLVPADAPAQQCMASAHETLSTDVSADPV